MNKLLLLSISLTGVVHAETLLAPSEVKPLHQLKLAQANSPQINLGDAMQGGYVACLNGGKNNLIVSARFMKKKGKEAVYKYADAQAKCASYQIDNKGNSPCKAENTCYDHWSIPSLDQLRCLYNNSQMLQKEDNKFPNCVVWSSDNGQVINFETGNVGLLPIETEVRCVRELQL